VNPDPGAVVFFYWIFRLYNAMSTGYVCNDKRLKWEFQSETNLVNIFQRRPFSAASNICGLEVLSGAPYTHQYDSARQWQTL